MKSKHKKGLILVIFKITLALLYIFYPKAYKFEHDIEQVLMDDNLNGFYHVMHSRK